MTVFGLSGELDTDSATPAVAPRVPVLVVDDNPSKRLALKAVLLPLGYRIVEADSGVAALRCVMEQDFAVILLDVVMPTMDGFETAALIRQRRQSEMTPIIFITAHGSHEIDHQDLYAEGAVDFIFAPVPPDELRAKVSVFANIFSKAMELARRAEAVQKSADQLRMLTDAAPIGIFQTDAAGRYVYTNPRWSEITGIAAADAAGRVWASIITPATPGGVVPGPVGTDGDQSDISHRVEIEIPGATRRVVVATSRAISDGAGGMTGRVGTLADVTAETDAERVMADARDKATEASRLKSDFLANMSHEIRTPMNGVIGMTDLLLETRLDSRQREYAQTVRNSGEALLTVVNDILDFSKVEAGKLEVEDIEYDLRSVVDDVVDLLAGPAQAKDLDLVAILEHSVPSVVRGDPGRVRQVLTNLVGNAIKFTQFGEVVVRAAAGDVVDGETVVRFEVSDSGVGIAPDKLATVFQPFVQADTSTSRKYGGTGLGLAISSQLVSLMGGTCGVTSRFGEGSDFWFTIGVHADDNQEPHVLQSRDAELTGMTALIVDDNASQCLLLSEYLTDWGMTVTTANSGEEALKAMRSAATHGEPFAVALLDQRMPGMDGLELTNAIVMEPSITARLVLMTGLGQIDNLERVDDCGIFASVSKPVHREELHACLRHAMGMLVADVAPAETAAWSSSSGEPQAGWLLLAEDNLINQKVAVAMLSSAGYRVDTALNGVAAVAAAAAHHYDAILMDCQMPEMNGYEATAAIRADEGTHHHTPIIAMTAGARREDRERCMAEGMDNYVAKPVSKEVLLALVARSVNQGQAALLLLPRGGPVTASDITIDLSVLDELRVLGKATEQDVVAELVDQFVHDTERRLVELRQAMEIGDANAVGRIAHSIKGSGGQLGGRRFAQSCDRLETKAAAGNLGDSETDLREVEFDYQELRYALTYQVAPADEQRARGNHA